jgi:hypothetical protein
MSRRWLGAACVLAVVVVAAPVSAYLKLGVSADGRLVSLRWDRTVDYLVTNRDVEGVSAPQLQSAVGRAFATWAAVPRTELDHRFVGFTGAEPVGGDGLTVVGFQSRPELERTLAAASFEIDEVTGRVLEVDIFFNTSVMWSVAPAGQSGRFDVESVGLHEVGHLLGLGHSALGETEVRAEGGRRVLGKRAVMFPIAYPAGNVEDRTLEADDRAGITDVYGTREAERRTGSVSGRVTLGGQGVFGAHITAVHTATGDMVSGFSLTPQGDFVIGGLASGVYIVRVEPLDDADLNSFFDDDAGVNVDFLPTFHSRLVAVPAGGAGPDVVVAVRAK